MTKFFVFLQTLAQKNHLNQQSHYSCYTLTTHPSSFFIIIHLYYCCFSLLALFLAASKQKPLILCTYNIISTHLATQKYLTRSSNSVMRQSVKLSFVAALSLTFISNFIAIPANVNLFVTSFLTIYVGSHRRLVQMEVRSSFSPTSFRSNQQYKLTQDPSLPSQSQSEQISTNDAYMFPVYGSMTLFSLYAVFKFFDKDYVNILLKTYFLFLGVCAMAATLHPFVKDEIKRFISESRFKSWTKIHKIDKKVPILSDLFELENFKTEGDIVLMFCAAISLVVASTYIYSKHWCFNNILGICFSIQGIENIGLSSVKVGVIVLVRLQLSLSLFHPRLSQTTPHDLPCCT